MLSRICYWKGKEEHCSLAERQTGPSWSFGIYSPKNICCKSVCLIPLRDTNASPNTPGYASEKIVVYDRSLNQKYIQQHWKLLRKSQMLTCNCAFTIGSTRTKPGILLIFTPLVGVKTVFSRYPCNSTATKKVCFVWLAIGQHATYQSPESTKVLQMKTEQNQKQGLFSQELCATVGFTDKEDGIHPREMHFQPYRLC